MGGGWWRKIDEKETETREKDEGNARGTGEGRSERGGIVEMVCGKKDVISYLAPTATGQWTLCAA